MILAGWLGNIFETQLWLRATGFLLVVGLAAAQTPTWEQSTASGHELKGQGRYAEAENTFRIALQKAEASADRERVAMSLNDWPLCSVPAAIFPAPKSSTSDPWLFGKHWRSCRSWPRG